ncbi:MAG: response regulator [Verrucomicrobia bacterium]|nr:response regulator [Verrucomicrobiota bacterium]
MVNQPVKVLLVEDNPGDARLLREILEEAPRSAFELAQAESLGAALRELEPGRFGLVLLDLSLPDARGLETVTRMRKAAPDIPIVVLTGFDDEGFALDAVREGAQDYLVKGQIHHNLLVRAMRYAIERHRLLREHQILEARLLQSQKLESIGKLAGGIAHDFNNLLTIIYGHSSLLLEAKHLPAEFVSSVERISMAAKRASNLTRQLLMFSRKQPLQPKKLDLRHVVTSMVRMLQPILGEDITLQVEHAPKLPAVCADQSMMEQVIMNLALNARDAMPKGGTLRLQTFAQTRHDIPLDLSAGVRRESFVCLAVRDTGCGIPPEQLAHVFEPFYTTKDPGHGTGLGLATVYGIVQQHNGWINVASEPDHGTTFEILLPSAGDCGEAFEEQQPTAPVPRGSEVVLVVEDEVALRELLRATLESNGYQVFEADSGVAALSVWRDHKSSIALLLTDVVMPGGLTGWELAERLRADKPDLRVLLTSGYAKEITDHGSAVRKDFKFLAKPYRPDHIARLVRDSLDAEPAKRAEQNSP